MVMSFPSLTLPLQYNELAILYGSSQIATPPLSLSSATCQPKTDTEPPTCASEILERSADRQSRDAANIVRAATTASRSLRHGLPTLRDSASHGVKIWSGPAADKPDASRPAMPSISECPLEQDFTVEGKPSKLGCPFASMANKKLSSHAASVLSRYNRPGSGEHTSTRLSTVSRVNGRDSLSQRQSRTGTIEDPIKADICGLSVHNDDEGPISDGEAEKKTTENAENAEAGVCPIRFLDQHSPEEVATYFENHKHELPRSHEVCVMRYQSNEEQIKQLDEKYGNLVSMIQGLGQKHKDMLPKEPEDGQDDEYEPDSASNEKVRKWASSVSAQAPDVEDVVDENALDERQSHFARPLRDIRVGESPSRPWGISVPTKYLETLQSETSSKPAQVNHASMAQVTQQAEKPAKCPFGHGAAGTEPRPSPHTKPHATQENAPDANITPETKLGDGAVAIDKKAPMVFTGPVFIGYSVDDAAKILSQSR